MELINNYYEDTQSTCLFFDLRGSTNLIRKISLVKEKKDKSSHIRMAKHAEFMIGIHRYLEKTIEELNIDKFYFNDTGDGGTLLFWDKYHIYDALIVACSLCIHLEKEILKYNKIIHSWGFESLKLDFGISMHTGGSIILKNKAFGRDFAYGIAVNSAARIESFTKNLSDIKVLFSGNFMEFIDAQKVHLSSEKKKALIKLKTYLVKVSDAKFKINDGKEDGHFLYYIVDILNVYKILKREIY
jgi:hypothetical protein